MTRMTATLALPLILMAQQAIGHGDTVPQSVVTAGLPDLPTEMAQENPWRETDQDLLFKAVEIGAKGYNSNCARCHGLEAISGGLAPDLRFLEANDFGDEWYLDRVLNGYEQNGAVKMPPFGDIMSQEAIWAIRTYIETRADADEISAKSAELTALRDEVLALGTDGSADQANDLADRLDASAEGLEALSGAPRAVTVMHQAAYALRANPSHAPAAAELVSGVLRN